MKKILFLIFTITLFTACETQKPLYSWSNYDAKSYNYLKNNDEKSTQELIENYKKIISKQEGTRKIVPPGIYADYGFLLIQMKKNKEGKAFLLKEIELYPESKIFIDRILKLIEE